MFIHPRTVAHLPSTFVAGAMFEDVGLIPDYKLVSSSSKTLSFKKL